MFPNGVNAPFCRAVLQIDRGYISPQFVTNQEKMQVSGGVQCLLCRGRDTGMA